MQEDEWIRLPFEEKVKRLDEWSRELLDLADADPEHHNFNLRKKELENNIYTGIKLEA